jgi:hypothetical protein
MTRTRMYEVRTPMDGKVSGWQLVVCDKSRLKGTGYSMPKH